MKSITPQQLLTIAQKYLNTNLSTLKKRDSDRLDFHSVSVWGITAALTKAYETGWLAAQESLKFSLTDRQKSAVIDVLNERLAGGVDDLRDGLGLSRKEASAMFTVLERVLHKLVQATPSRAVDHLDGNPCNNDIPNLRIIEVSENLPAKGTRL